MKVAPTLFLVLLAGCRSAAYEIVHGTKPRNNSPTVTEPPAPEDASLTPTNPPPAEPTTEEPQDSSADAPPGTPIPEIPEVQHSEPPFNPEEPDQMAKLCSEISLCSRKELPKCTASLSGLTAFIRTTETRMVCMNNKWQELHY